MSGIETRNNEMLDRLFPRYTPAIVACPCAETERNAGEMGNNELTCGIEVGIRRESTISW
jgi:hypothetical protein